MHSANVAYLRVSSETHKEQQIFGGCLDVFYKKAISFLLAGN